MKIEIELIDKQVEALEFMRKNRNKRNDTPVSLEDIVVDLIDKVCKDVYVYIDN